MTVKFERLSDPSPINMADSWYQYASTDHFWFQWRFFALRRLVRDVDLGTRVLEIGCGNGVAGLQFEREFDVSVDGCDLNEAALRMAAGGRGSLYVYDIHDRRPEWEGFFDSILLLDTLEHIDDPIGFLRSAAFHLHPEGLMVFNVPAMSWLYSRYDEIAGHVKRYDKRLLRKELADAGLSLCAETYWGLTMIPVLMARKLVVGLLPHNKVIKGGFQPSWPTEWFLRLLMHAERSLLGNPCVGSSLAAIARPARTGRRNG